MVTLTPSNAAAQIKRLGGLEVKPVSSEERGLVMGIYGEPGVGKTTLAASITDSEFGSPALYIDARGNPHVVNSYAGKIDVVTVEKFAHFEAIRQSLLKDKDLSYKTVIIDTLTEAWSIDLRDLYGPTGDVDWQKHSASTADILQLIRNYSDLTTQGPRVNVVFVMQETLEERTVNNQKVTRPEIHFNKKLQEYIPSLINFLGRLYIYETTPPYRRVLDFTPANTVHQGKMQRDPNDPAARDIPFQIYNPSLAPLLDTIRGHVPWPIEAHSRPRTTQQQQAAR
jgi:AAA domain